MFANPVEGTLVAMRRGDLTDEQWVLLDPLLPPHKPNIGRPNKDHRRIVNGFLWINRTGAPWRDLPERYGPWRTVARGTRTTIPRKKNEHRGGSFDRYIYRTRNRIERLINRLKQYRRVATRYEKRADNYQAMLTIAAIMLWL